MHHLRSGANAPLHQLHAACTPTAAQLQKSVSATKRGWKLLSAAQGARHGGIAGVRCAVATRDFRLEKSVGSSSDSMHDLAAVDADAEAIAMVSGYNTDELNELETSLDTTSSRLGNLLFLSKGWYFLSGGSGVFLIPYLSLYFQQELGFTETQLGMLSATRPWLSSAAMFAGTAIADALGCHHLMLVGCLLTSTLLRTYLLFCGGGVAIPAAIAIASDFLGAPVGPFVDSLVVKTCQQTGASYGHHRMWTSVAWGGFALVSGFAMQQYGFGANFLAYFLLSVPLLLITLNLKRPPLPPVVEQLKQQLPLPQPTLAEVPVAPLEGSGTVLEGTLHFQQQTLEAAGVLDVLEHIWTQAEASTEDQPTMVSEAAGHTLASGHTLHVQQQQQSLQVEPSLVVSQEESAAHAAGAATGAAAGAASLGSDRNSKEGVPLAALQPAAPAGAEVALLTAVAKDQGEGGRQLQGAAARAPESTAAKSVSKPGMKDLLADTKVWGLLFQSLMLGVAGPGIVGTFLFIFMNDLGASPTLMSSLLMVDCFVEVIVFNSLPAILKHMNSEGLLRVAQCALVLQLLGYAASDSPWQVVPVEVLQGVAFACGWSAICAKAKDLAPEGLEATMLGMITAAYFGIGTGAGALLGGVLLEGDLGWGYTWTAAAGLVAVTAGLPVVWSYLSRNRRELLGIAAPVLPSGRRKIFGGEIDAHKHPE